MPERHFVSIPERDRRFQERIFMKDGGRLLFERRNALFLLLLCPLLQAPSAAGASGDEEVFRWGFRERVRQEYLVNSRDLEDDLADDRNHIRFRSQLWFSLKPRGDVEIYAGLNNEHRHFYKPDRKFDIDEFIFENLYIRAERLAGYPVTVVAGRQNIRFGEGFLYMDGGALDGSRTMYFNALRVIVGGDERSVEVHALKDPYRDTYLPRIKSRRKRLTEWNESGAGLYYKERSLERADIDAYYFYKRERDDEALVPETRLHTVGSRITATPSEGFSMAAEGACQFGHRGGNTRRGIGGYAHCTYMPALPLDPSFTAGVIYLSGDDPVTEDYEGWDPLYSRWPKWSDLYIYTLANESGAAYWDNLFAPNFWLSVGPLSRIELSAGLYLLSAPEGRLEPAEVTPEAGLRVFGTGKDRGVLSVLKLSWSAGGSLSGHLQWERLDPGDYYGEGRDTVHFLRWQLLFDI